VEEEEEAEAEEEEEEETRGEGMATGGCLRCTGRSTPETWGTEWCPPVYAAAGRT
jgi:hypothetical protein